MIQELLPLKVTARDLILAELRRREKPLAVHELCVTGVSECSASARLREMAEDGLVIGKKREGKSFKEWSLP